MLMTVKLCEIIKIVAMMLILADNDYNTCVSEKKI